MKKTLFMLSVGALMLATPSCKKGENDPLSLSSRKGRLAGEYTVSAYSSSSTSTNPDNDVTVVTEELSGNTITKTTVWTPSGGGTSTTATTNTTLNLGEFVINKDGTYTRTWNLTSVTVEEDEIFGTTITMTSTETSTMVENGSWNFLGKYDEYKNKERVVFNATDVATTSQTNVHTVTDDGSGTTSEEHTMGDTYKNNYTMGNGESPMIFAIDQLKGKEIIMIQESSGTTQNSVTSGSITETSNYSDQNSLSMTLTQK